VYSGGLGNAGTDARSEEVLVHGVDLAAATGQRHRVDQALCEELLQMMVSMGGIDAYRQPGMFGADRPCDPLAPAHARLAAYLGRDLRA